MGLIEKIVDWIDERAHVREIYRTQMVEYKVAKNLTFPYVFGILALVTFAIQIISGMVLILYYNLQSQTLLTVHLLDNGRNSLRMALQAHTRTGANFFMAIVYLHMFTGIYYNAYKRPRELVWIVGWLIYFVLILTALSGYLLPWGQLSYWGFIVTTEIPGSLADAPILKPIFKAIAETIVLWMKGGYVVTDVTLGRVFGSHVLIYPLILLALVGIHLYLVRAAGISNPEGIEYDKKKNPDKFVPFHPYMTLKEGAYVMWYLAVFFFFVFFHISHFLPPENFEPANPLKTPAHIAPEWYLLGYYEVFRSIPSKFWGFVAFNALLLLLLLLPFLDFSPLKSARRRPLFFVMFVIFMISSMALTILGTMPPTPQNAKLGLIFAALVFAFFISLPIISFIEYGWYKAKGGQQE
ncbi:cytochrome b [Aquifex aeolicus]|uniref:Cytochrome b n=1 Tax=Aquifex aeolicus (strain VF5) TaxID=224324 RepID=O66459_AQUAE|nr:cytochrome bc complex cytochrome b subunit [Aquifex aeolicus]AAC06424.1 cytochrome b [Aquifex aeolicus VF5]